jgi:hypothetical protein
MDGTRLKNESGLYYNYFWFAIHDEKGMFEALLLGQSTS